MTTWNTHLSYYQASDHPLLDVSFMGRWGSETWEPTAADKAAAAELHTQIVSRVATQPLGYADGDEAAALESIHVLFGKARDAADRHFGANHYDRLVWHVLNTHVRPFTARWHPLSKAHALDALDATDEFRAELTRLQGVLVRFDTLLLDMRDGRRPPPEMKPATRGGVLTEMDAPLQWGIHSVGSGVGEVALSMEVAERSAIEARRSTYGLDAGRVHATGLALSGGGIRSATFSLGVLVALAKRNLLPEFDYLSTVSGGGYLGAFMTTFMTTPEQEEGAEPVGLGAKEAPFHNEPGEAEALRYIRHRSKYLQTSLWERLSLGASQVYGMAVNGLAFALFPVAFALADFLLRGLADTAPLRWAAWVVIAVSGTAGAVVPFAASRCRRVRRRADRILGVAAAAVALTGIWTMLGVLHDPLAVQGRISAAGPATPYLLGLVAALPMAASFAVVLLPQRTGHLQRAFGILAALAAPLFIVGVELCTYRWLRTQYYVDDDLLQLPRAWVPAILIAVFLPASLMCLDVNFTSPYRHYRRKLAETFLIRRSREPKPGHRFEAAVSIKLSDCVQGARGPYPLINCALNVPGSSNPAMQGRLTDFFLFSPAFCGSPLTGYMPTREWEAADPLLDLGGAMAVSGGAASPLMGLGTRRHLRFWMALLNIRLGYWVRRPTTSLWRLPGLFYLLREMLGLIDENAPFLNVTDGGHIENLGVYELLRRRCKYIVTIDGEHDASMTFHGLTNLQRLASIDLGVTIDLDLDDLRLSAKGLSRSHFKFCRVHYPSAGDRPAGTGYLLYLKLSLTGNEGEFLKRYRFDEPLFPHHPTANQFFTEAQFEAYRSLGEHVGNKLFLDAIVGDAQADGHLDIEQWFAALGAALLRAR